MRQKIWLRHDAVAPEASSGIHSRDATDDVLPSSGTALLTKPLKRRSHRFRVANFGLLLEDLLVGGWRDVLLVHEVVGGRRVVGARGSRLPTAAGTPAAAAAAAGIPAADACVIGGRVSGSRASRSENKQNFSKQEW